MALLREEGLEVSAPAPRRVNGENLAHATRVISMGCPDGDIGDSPVAIEPWDGLPLASQDLAGAFAAIKERVVALVDEMVAAQAQ